MNTRIIKLFLRRQDIAYVPLDNGLRIQVLPSIQQLPQCQKHHFAAFLQDSSMLVVWDDDPNHILIRAQNIEDQLMSMIWKEQDEEDGDEKTASHSKMASQTPSIHVTEFAGSARSDMEVFFEEPPRRPVLIQALATALTLLISVAAIGTGFRRVAVELGTDGRYVRLAFIAVAPLQLWLALVSLYLKQPIERSSMLMKAYSSSFSQSLVVSASSSVLSAK